MQNRALVCRPSNTVIYYSGSEATCCHAPANGPVACAASCLSHRYSQRLKVWWWLPNTTPASRTTAAAARNHCQASCASNVMNDTISQQPPCQQPRQGQCRCSCSFCRTCFLSLAGDLCEAGGQERCHNGLVAGIQQTIQPTNRSRVLGLKFPWVLGDLGSCGAETLIYAAGAL